MKLAKRIVGILFLVTLVLAVLYIGVNILAILNSPFTSFPWWSPIGFAAIYFGPWLLLEAALYCILCWLPK